VSEAAEEPIVVRHGDMPETQSPGVVRWQAFADDHRAHDADHEVWVGQTCNEPGQWSNWHIHPDYVTYGYELTGRLRVEYGPGGAKSIEAGPGDFVRIPAGIVHREGSLGHIQRTGIGVRIGHGPLVVEVNGPAPVEDPGADTGEGTSADTTER
jgi:quercetin dioxygenase-like cupin family protein